MELGFARRGRVQHLLQQAVQRLGAAGAHLGGTENLDIPDGVKAIAPGQTGGHQVTDQLLAGFAVGLQKEEIIFLSALLKGAAADNVVGILHNQAPPGLTENPFQADGGHRTGTNHFAQDIAGADAGQLVGVSHHDDPAVGPQGRQQALEQLDIHHTHFVQDDHVALEEVLFVVDEADHAPRIIHLQKPVDGGGLAAGQLAQPLGCPPGGGAEGHPLGLTLQNLEDCIDGGGLAGAGAAGQNQTVLGDRPADGLLLFGGIGKALGQFQHLDLLFHLVGSLFFPPDQSGQPGRDGLLGGQEFGQVDIISPVPTAGGQLPAVQAALQSGGQFFVRLMDEGGRCRYQPFPGQTGMTVAGVVAQGPQQGRLQTLGTIPFHLIILGDAVGVAEIQLERLAAEQVGIGSDGLGRPRAKGAEHLHGPPGSDLKLGQVGNQLPHPEHPLEFLLDAVGLVG